MTYRNRLDDLSQMRDFKGLLALGEEALHSDTVNDVLVAVVAADRALNTEGDNALRIAYEAGKAVGSLFRFEAARTWREYPLDHRTLAAFGAQAYRLGSNPEMLKYKRDSDHVLIIQGDENRYLETCAEFQQFLIDDLGFNPENMVDFASLTEGINVDITGTVRDVRDATLPILRATASNIAQKAGRFSNLVIYHNGHGVDGSFLFIEAEVPYRDWAKPLLGNVGNIAVVNDASEASSMHRAIVDTGISQKRLMVLSACDIGEQGYGNLFSKEVMEAYRNGRPYTPKPRTMRATRIGVEKPVIKPEGIEITLKNKGQTEIHITPSKHGIDLDYMLMKFSDTQTVA